MKKDKFLSDAYWNNRYVNQDTFWDIGYISTPLKNYIDQLTDKSLKILIPGAGNCHEAKYLHEKGFTNVYILDFATEPIKNFLQQVPDFPKNHIIQSNFFDHIEKYDVILEQTFFCALNPSLRKDYVNHMHQILQSNGKLVGLLFDDALNQNEPPFGGNQEEYKQLFSEKFQFHIFEPAKNSIPPRAGRELFIMFLPK